MDKGRKALVIINQRITGRADMRLHASLMVSAAVSHLSARPEGRGARIAIIIPSVTITGATTGLY